MRLYPEFVLFQSTPPARGATLVVVGRVSRSAGISIHAPREGGDGYQYEDLRLDVISIHAPREGGDFIVGSSWAMDSLFQSTPPARGATNMDHYDKRQLDISIHAPREGGDSKDAQFYL